MADWWQNWPILDWPFGWPPPTNYCINFVERFVHKNCTFLPHFTYFSQPMLPRKCWPNLAIHSRRIAGRWELFSTFCFADFPHLGWMSRMKCFSIEFCAANSISHCLRLPRSVPPQNCWLFGCSTMTRICDCPQWRPWIGIGQRWEMEIKLKITFGNF